MFWGGKVFKGVALLFLFLFSSTIGIYCSCFFRDPLLFYPTFSILEIRASKLYKDSRLIYIFGS